MPRLNALTTGPTDGEQISGVNGRAALDPALRPVASLQQRMSGSPPAVSGLARSGVDTRMPWR